MGNFKTAKQMKDEQGIKYLLHKEIPYYDEPRPMSTLHASDLTREDVPFCPREWCLMLRDGDSRKPKFINTALSVTFQIGRWYEDQVRNNWLRKYSIGDWVCTCGHIETGTTVPEHCEKCGVSGGAFTYIEPRAYSDVYGVSCGIDMLRWQGGRIHVTEIKSIKGEDFNNLHAPLSEHRRRTAFYLDLLEHSNWMDYDVEFNLDEAEILYISKGFGCKDDYKDREGAKDGRISPFKVFKVKRGSHESMKPIYDKALEVKHYRETGELPARTLCSTITCKRASKCPVREACFLGKD